MYNNKNPKTGKGEIGVYCIKFLKLYMKRYNITLKR